jgi:hypothetical protein
LLLTFKAAWTITVRNTSKQWRIKIGRKAATVSCHTFCNVLRTNLCISDCITEHIKDDTDLAVRSPVTQNGRVQSSLGENEGAIELIFQTRSSNKNARGRVCNAEDTTVRVGQDTSRV